MKQKRKKSKQVLSVILRGQQVDNGSTTFQDLDQQDDQIENENITTPTLSDDNLNSTSSCNEANLQEKEELLVVKIRDLEKHVETLEEKMTGYEEIKEELEEIKKRLMQHENHLKALHSFLQAKLGSELPTFNFDSS